MKFLLFIAFGTVLLVLERSAVFAETFTKGVRVSPETVTLKPGEYVWEPERAPEGPLLIVASITEQVADDLGWKDVGFNGATDIKTPNLDRLAQTGARLEQFYAQPMCTPTRAALLTGRYPNHYGLQTIVIPSVSSYGLAIDEWLLPEALEEAGYHTAIIGKWHLGHADRKYWPKQRGFDYQYGPLIGELDYFTHEEHGVLDWYRDNKPVKEKGYTTILLGDDAVKYIDNATVPFFLYLAFNAPHTPYQAPREYIDRYKNIRDFTRRTYAGMVTCLDDQIGRVVDALDKKKLRDNTLIVFQSDNGGTFSDGSCPILEHPDKVAELQKRIEELAKTSTKPLFLIEQFKAMQKGLQGEPALPNEDAYYEQEGP